MFERTLFFPLFVFIWTIFIQIPFSLLNLISKLFEVINFSFINFMLFGIERIDNFDFNQLNTSIYFKIFAIVSLFLFIFILLFVFLKWSINKGLRSKNYSFLSRLKHIISYFVLLLLTPIIIFSSLLLLNNFFEIILKSFEIKANLANSIFMSLLPYKMSSSDWLYLANLEYAAPTIGMFLSFPGSSAAILFFPALIGIWSFKTLASAIVRVSMQTFQMLVLFSVSPFIYATMIYDNAYRFKIWKNLFIRNVLTIMCFIIGLRLFEFYVLIINKWDLRSFQGIFDKNIIISLFIIGGLIASTQLNKLVYKFTNQNYKLKQHFVQTQDLFKNAKHFVTNKHENSVENLQNLNNEPKYQFNKKQAFPELNLDLFAKYNNQFNIEWNIENKEYKTPKLDFQDHKFFKMYKEINATT